MTYTIRLTRAVPALELRPDDVVILEPGADEPIVLYRPLAEPVAVGIELLASGAAVQSRHVACRDCGKHTRRRAAAGTGAVALTEHLARGGFRS